MSVKSALMAKSYEPFVSWLEQQIRNMGMDQREFLRRSYGMKEGTQTSLHPHSVFGALRGEARATDKTLEKWARGLGMSVDVLKDKRNACDGVMADMATSYRVRSVEWEPEDVPVLNQTEVPSVLPPFSMMIASDGRAHIQVNATGIPLDAAMRILQVLRDEKVFTP